MKITLQGLNSPVSDPLEQEEEICSDHPQGRAVVLKYHTSLPCVTCVFAAQSATEFQGGLHSGLLIRSWLGVDEVKACKQLPLCPKTQQVMS